MLCRLLPLTEAGEHSAILWRPPLARQMPGDDHSVDFWRSVATTFLDNPNVLFDAFNEPFGVDWDC